MKLCVLVAASGPFVLELGEVCTQLTLFQLELGEVLHEVVVVVLNVDELQKQEAAVAWLWCSVLTYTLKRCCTTWW